MWTKTITIALFLFSGGAMADSAGNSPQTNCIAQTAATLDKTKMVVSREAAAVVFKSDTQPQSEDSKTNR